LCIAACVGVFACVGAAQCPPGQAGNVYDGTGADSTSASSQNLPNAFSSADNITVGAAGDITTLCFWGRYQSTNLPATNVEQFRVTFYADGGGFPSSTVFAGPFTLNQAGGNLSVRAALANPALGFVWSATFPAGAVHLGAGQCVWMEILGDTPGAVFADRFRWNLLNPTGVAPFKDGHCVQRDNAASAGYSQASRLPFDLAWATNLTAAPAGCQLPPAANSLCSGATPLAQPTTAVPVTMTGIDSARGQLVPTIPCKGLSVSGPGLWYSVVGNGTTYTFSTCGGTTYDTVVGVYCGSCTGSDNSGLNCVASNDSAAGACTGGPDPSMVSWPTTSGLTYLICVYGYEQATGTLAIRLETDGVQAATHPACVSDFCPVDLTGIPPANFESDACGAETNGVDCDDVNVRTIVIGQTYAGTIQTDGPNRDRDFWEVSGLQPNSFYRLTGAAEIPAIFFTFDGPCAHGSSLGNLSVAEVFTYCDALDTIWQTDGSGVGRVMVTTNEFYGLPCSLNRNHYKFKLEYAPPGSCCQPAQACVIGPQSTCNQVPGSVWTLGRTCAPTDPCFGACCTGSSCAVIAVTSCTGGGTVFFPGATACSPTTCLPPGVCCRGATCNTSILLQGNCTVTGGTAGAAFVVSSSCNAAPVSMTPCCFANYNKINGITVQDIFDFLTDWFSGSPYARVGSNGATGVLTVQNIFDFLSNWFAGGCT
jgi:hypothetical protein